MSFKNLTSLLIIFVFNSSLICQLPCSSFSSYFGGTQFDEIKSVCVDANKNCYVIGNTYSSDLPVTLGLISDAAPGDYDVFVAKFDSCGVLLWSTYFGDIAYESAEKMALANDGNIVFCGYTSSAGTPTTNSCFQATNNGGYDCYITKITPGGTIIWSTFFGKAGGDFAFDLKLDRFDNIIIGGTTTSTNLYTTPSSFQPNHKGNTDAFIARFSKDGQLHWCTYYGGNGSEDIHALQVDRDCNIIGVGESFSGNLSTSPGAFQSNNNGMSDAYIIKLDSNGTRVFSSYIGGSSSDDAWGLVCDSTNTIFMAGHSNSVNFPTTALSYQTLNKGGLDCYLAKWSPTGTLLKCTLFGDTLNEASSRLIALSPSQLLLFTETESLHLPTSPTSPQSMLAGSYDVYFTIFDATNLYPTWGSYYGGTFTDDATDAALVSSSELVFCGSTDSPDFPVSVSAYQTSLNNSVDGVISKIKLPTQTSTFINEYSNILSCEIYPNPFSDYLMIKSAVPFVVEIKNMLGQSIYSAQNTSRISTKDFGPGIYVVSINSKSYRFIKN